MTPPCPHTVAILIPLSTVPKRKWARGCFYSLISISPHSLAQPTPNTYIYIIMIIIIIIILSLFSLHFSSSIFSSNIFFTCRSALAPHFSSSLLLSFFFLRITNVKPLKKTISVNYFLQDKFIIVSFLYFIHCLFNLVFFPFLRWFLSVLICNVGMIFITSWRILSDDKICKYCGIIIAWLFIVVCVCGCLWTVYL